MTTLRVVLRGLVRTPLFAVVAIISLALGIGANTAIFSMLDQTLLRTIPVRNPQELAYFYQPGPFQGSVSEDELGSPSFSYPMFRELQKEQTPFVALSGARSQPVSLAYKNVASNGMARLVSGNYFDLLGVQPALGRLFSEDDDRSPGGHPLAILGYGYWSSRFGGDPAVLNQTVLVNGYPLTIVGVAQKGFTSEKLADNPDVYAPLTMKKELTPDFTAAMMMDRQNYWFSIFGRLKPGIKLDQAAAAINLSYRGPLEEDIALLRHPQPEFVQQFRAKKIVLKPGEHGRGNLRSEVRQPLTLLMGITMLVLAIACANVANLQLARGAARTREVAVRLAIGASRMQLIRQLLLESCLLSIAGGCLGLLAAQLTIRGILASVPPGGGFANTLSAGLDVRILVFSMGLSIATGVVFGLFPALQSSKADLVSALKSQAGQVSSSGSANAFRKTLVTAQIGISLLLLITAGLFGKTLVNLSRVDLGVRSDHLMTFSLLPKLSRYTDQSIAGLYEQLSARLAAIPGVTLVSTSEVPAIAGSRSSTGIAVEGYTTPAQKRVQVNFNAVGAGFFRTLGMPLISGREFTAADNLAAPKVAMVNETFARKYFANQNPLGRHLGRGDKADSEIVGVVKDAKYASMKEAPPAVFYTPITQNARWYFLVFYLRTGVDPESTAPLIRREVAAVDANLPIREMKTMQTQIEENMYSEHLLSVLTTSFAMLATVLAAVGLYGVLAFNVARRTREIGIRLALGADSARVRGLVAREVGLMLAIGTVVGGVAAAACGKLVQSFLFGMKPWDITVYVLAMGTLWLVALGSAYVPVRRATRVDPTVALRYE